MHRRRALRRLFWAALDSRCATVLLRPLTRGVATVLTLHRFADPEQRTPGHCTRALRQNLAHLRKQGFQFVPLTEIYERFERGEAFLDPTVCFTVDDGYEDFVRLGVPVFAEFDCPVHLFATTGFLDRHLWMWWDRVEFILDHSDGESTTLEVNGRLVQLHTRNEGDRRESAVQLCELLKNCREAVRHEAIATLSEVTGVCPPTEPPASYRAVEWGQLAALRTHGVSVGPHTVTHPILSQVTDEQSASEIRESWLRVRTELPGSAPIFCYPNGYATDFGTREHRLLEAAGLRAAMTCLDGYISPHAFAQAPDARYALPRFAYPEEPQLVQRIVGGFERARMALRSGAP